MSKTARSFSLKVLALALMCLLAAALLGPVPAARAGGGGLYDITGIVSDSSGNRIADVSVTATDPGGTSVDYGPVTTATDGSYDLQVVPGTYDIHFTPEADSGLSTTVDADYVVSSDQTLDVQLDLNSTTTISGVVTDADGHPDPGVDIDASGSGQIAVSDSSGNYSADVAPGQYYLSASVFLDNNDVVQNSLTSAVQASPGGDLIEDFQMPDTSASLTVTALDENGNPASDASVYYGEEAADCSGGSGHCTTLDSDGNNIPISSSGQITLPAITDSTISTGGLCVTYGDVYSQSSPVTCNTSPITIGTSSSVTFNEPAQDITTISGVVTDADGHPDPGVDIDASGSGQIAVSDSSGNTPLMWLLGSIT